MKNEHIQHLINRATARLPSARGVAQRNAQADLEQRQAASTILNPNEVSGEYDGGRLLQTSLRGALRPITQKDLRAFQSNVTNLKKKFVGGITAQGVIDLALDADKQRANKEIRVAVPVSIRGPLFHFITNAGPDSDVTRHHVHVEFMDFDAAVGASPNDQKKIGKTVANGRLKFDCDCGRHRYWFRYIATIGKYNYGRAETGYPKIRNPKLHGVACKHVLRTMHVILKDANTQLKIAQQVIKARAALDGTKLKTERTKAADARTHAAEQHAKRKSSTNLKTTAQKQAANAARRARESMKKAAVEKAKVDAKKPSAAAKKIERSAHNLLALGAITQEQFNEIMKNAK
jgi:hypothetical protein